MKELQKKLGKKSYSLFSKINKIIKFKSFLNIDSFDKKKDELNESFKKENKIFKLTQKNINFIYESLLLENLQNQIKVYKNHIYLMTDLWYDMGKLNINDFALVVEYFGSFNISYKNAQSILKNVINILTVDELDINVIQLLNCYIENGNLKYGKFLDGIPRFNINKIFLNKKITESDFPNINAELEKLCDNNLDTKEFLLENLATIFITDFKIKNSFNSFIKINNNKTFLNILARTFEDENLVKLKDVSLKNIPNDYISILYSSVIVSENKKTTREVININKKYDSDLNNIIDDEYFLFFNFLMNKSLEILQRNPIILINKSNKQVDTNNNLESYLKKNKNQILYYSVKKVRDDYEKYCKVNKIVPLSKTDFNKMIMNILNLKQITTWSSLIKDINLKTKRTYAWLPNK
jgi:hypothetical protein